jgi:hypothetical protein
VEFRGRVREFRKEILILRGAVPEATRSFGFAFEDSRPGLSLPLLRSLARRRLHRDCEGAKGNRMQRGNETNREQKAMAKA